VGVGEPSVLGNKLVKTILVGIPVERVQIMEDAIIHSG
jgi:hypothetical protein